MAESFSFYFQRITSTKIIFILVSNLLVKHFIQNFQKRTTNTLVITPMRYNFDFLLVDTWKL